MANLVKTYHCPPTWDVPPGGPLVLGTVLSSTKYPLPPLVIRPLTNFPPPPTATTSSTLTGDAQDGDGHPQISSTTKYNVSYKTSTGSSGSVSLFASFASAVLGVGPTASAKLSHDCVLTLRFAREDTFEWYPSTAELQNLAKHPSVTGFLASLRVWDTKDLFVVTGLKVAYGARAESKDARKVESELEVSLDPGVVGGAPGVVEFGPGLGLSRKKGSEVGWETGADGKEDPGFIFAYKVLKVKIKKKNGEVMNVTSKPYLAGALYGEAGSTKQKTNKPEEYEIEAIDAKDDIEEGGVFVEREDGDDHIRLVPC